jgi:hypothetical protein
VRLEARVRLEAKVKPMASTRMPAGQWETLPPRLPETARSQRRNLMRLHLRSLWAPSSAGLEARGSGSQGSGSQRGGMRPEVVAECQLEKARSSR